VVCDRAVRAVQTCHHLHGGFGVDITYPLHRYLSRLVDVSRLLGGVDATLTAVPAVEGEGKGAELTESQLAFRDEIRTYFSGLVSHEDRVEMLTDRHGPAYHRTIEKMGADKMMGVGWPTEYGGRGLGGIEQQIFANEAARSDVHLPAVTLQTVGPTLQAFGTQEQKDKFLPDILAGKVHFAIGYSEADAGTDLASLRCAARKDPATGDYIVNGQKMWTTGGHAADYIWLAVRTDPDAPKHKGISVLIVDTKDPGYSWTPIVTCDGSHHVNATAYDDIRVPAGMLVGEENAGWRLITTQLNHERVMLGPAGRLEGLRDLVADWASQRGLLDLPDVHDVLARVTATFRVNELLNWQVASATGGGVEAIADASASKVLASDAVQGLGMDLQTIVARHGDPSDPETAYLLHYLDLTAKRNLVLTFGGGVNEVQRELIAQFGLGLPRVPR
jgi:alkylation response protein AidB-like acyl-CoA dehydrogenase